MKNEKNELIETVDENGNKISFELLDIVDVDGVEYAMLIPPETEEENDESEVLVMRLKKDGEDYSFETIDNDDEFEKVAQYIEQLEDEIDDEE